MLKKNLHLCFSRIHCLPSSFSHPLTLEEDDEQENTTTTATTSSDETSTSTTTEPDFSVVFASNRFFVSSPGTSNSILDDRHSLVVVPGGGIPVRKVSPDPYVDFKKSMEEMVRARRETLDPTADNESWEWEYLHELLLCYLSLNPKQTHKFIIGAFTDLLLSLLSSASERGGSDRRPAATTGNFGLVNMIV